MSVGVWFRVCLGYLGILNSLVTALDLGGQRLLKGHDERWDGT